MAISSGLGSSALLPAGLGFRNLIINGDFKIWQRGTSATTITKTASSSFLADRWSAYRFLVGCTQSQVTSGLDGFQYAMRLQRTAGGASTNNVFIGQSFETVNIIPLGNKQITFSFYARAGSDYSAVANAFRLRVFAGTGTECNVVYVTPTNVSTPVDTTVTLTTGWQRFYGSGTVPAGTTQLGCQFEWTPTGTAGTNDYVDITGVQLEANSQPTPFEQRPIGVEDFLCKRYYQIWSNSSNTNFMTIGSSLYSTPMSLSVPMRTLNSTSTNFVAVVYAQGGSYALNSLGVTVLDASRPQYFTLSGTFSGSWNYSWPVCTFNTHTCIFNAEV